MQPWWKAEKMRRRLAWFVPVAAVLAAVVACGSLTPAATSPAAATAPLLATSGPPAPAATTPAPMAVSTATTAPTSAPAATDEPAAEVVTQIGPDNYPAGVDPLTG